MKKIVPMYPWPMHPKIAEQMASLSDINPVQALPGGPGPVLAIRKLPPFVCDVILVMEPGALSAAVRIVAGDGLEMVSMREHIGKIVGAEVSETVESYVSSVKFQ